MFAGIAWWLLAEQKKAGRALMLTIQCWCCGVFCCLPCEDYCLIGCQFNRWLMNLVGTIGIGISSEVIYFVNLFSAISWSGCEDYLRESCWIMSLKWFPLASKSLYWSKLAQAGDKRRDEAFPFFPCAIAAVTASVMDGWDVTSPV